ncbi:hypothetical protein [Phenylobacterium sp.]|jgi:hypothetical protein|uniref:hypothetical protein n=1 Tax=Phenylobacterium sp. TaxID=1871053 RepID=UPI00378342A0
MAVTPIDMSVLLGLYQSRAGIPASGGAGTTPKVAPTAPWTKTPSATQAAAEASATVRAALAGRKMIDENAAQLDLPGASADYRKLFALYQGLTTLNDVASRAQAKGLTGADRNRLDATFSRGMSEVLAYIDTVRLDAARVSQGEAVDSAKTKLAVAKAGTEYVTPPLTNSATSSAPAFEGDVNFTIKIKRLSVEHEVPIDLAGMGGQTRSLSNVINYINDQLAGAGLETRIQTQRIPAQPRTIEANGKTITLPAGADQWAMKVKVGTSEKVSFSAPATAGAVYVAQSVGDPDPDRTKTTNDSRVEQQFLKFQTDTAQVAAPEQPAGAANWVEGRVFAQTLDPDIKTIRTQTVGPDGSVYMLADVTGETAGQGIKGQQDVALLKYDSAGKLIYARTLGAAETASGLALAVSSDGKIAVAGSVTGALSGATEGAMNSSGTTTSADKSDSFVTLYDADGQELWTQRRGARQEDEASHVAFGADGAVYVAGRSKSAMQGADAIGNWDSYVQAFKTDAKGKVTTLFTQSFGSAGADRTAGLVVDGNALVTASVEDGRAVLRRFELSGGAPTLAATRDLGDLQGGDIAGLALDGGNVVVAGTTQNGFLAAGSVTRNHAGGTDAFAARLSANLSAGPGDRVAYYGGAGDDRAVSLAVAGGQVWIGGSVGADLPGHDAVGKKDGFLARLDIASGAVAWSQRFSGKDGMATPTAIAVDAKGSSVLDRLGLPTGALDLSDSEQLTAASALRAGEKFTVKVGEGRTADVTIEANDTFDTLARKIRRASGFQAKVTVATASGARTLKIEPVTPRVVIEIGAGTTNKDALEMLGLSESVIRATVTDDGMTLPADGKSKIYGLGLPRDLNLSDPEQIRHALAELGAAMGEVRGIYKDLVAAATPKSALQSAQASANGPVPAYLTNQIANYQAALARLTGGG